MEIKLTLKKKSPLPLIIGLGITAFCNKPIAIFLLSAFQHFVNHEGGYYEPAVQEDPKYKVIRIVVIALLLFFLVFKKLFGLTRREKKLLKIMDKRMRKQEKRINKRMRKETDALAAMTGDAMGQVAAQSSGAGPVQEEGKKKKRRFRKEQPIAGKDVSGWLTRTELCDIIPAKKFSDLSSVRKDGIPVYADYDEKKKELFVNIQPPCHTLVVGATGSGKTTMVVNSTIQVLGSTGSRPSMVCLDPKGELFASHSGMLKARGYNIINLNLRNPLDSDKWNPLESIRDKYIEFVTVGQEIWERSDTVDESGLYLTTSLPNYKEIWYEFQGKAYAAASAALTEVKKVRAEIFDGIYSELSSVLSALSPVTEGAYSANEKNAYILIESIALAILEDNGIYENDFSFSAIKNTLLGACSGGDGIRTFFSQREDDSVAKDHSQILITLADEKLSEVIAVANEKLSIFNDESISTMTAESELSINDLVSRPTAIFLSAPEGNNDRNRLASVLLQCIYRGLLRLADSSEQLALPKNFYFIMDEFGNCPAITGFDAMITAGRSRRIFFMVVVQSLSQLVRTYGPQIADIIQANCPTKFCLGSNDSETCDEFSRLCGQTLDDYGDALPLLHPSKLSGLNTASDPGNALVIMEGINPLRARITPGYLCPKYDIGLKQDDNPSGKRKKAKASAIAAMLLAAGVSALVFGAGTVNASSLSYEGELSATNLAPEDSSKDKKPADIVKVSRAVFFDKDNKEYIYMVANGEGLVRSTILDGMMVRSVVKLYPEKNVDLTMYRDGEKVEEPHFDNIWEPGDYVIMSTCGNVRSETIMSFSIIGERTGKYRLFSAPASFKIKEVKFDYIKQKVKTKKMLSLEKEGRYYIRCYSKKTKEDYVLEVIVDRTPPVIVFSGMDEKGVVKKGGLMVVSYDESDTIDVFLNDEKIDFSPEGFYETGNYRFNVEDVAGNTRNYEFTVMAYYGNSIRSLIFIFIVMVVSLVVYLIREKKKFRVR